MNIKNKNELIFGDNIKMNNINPHNFALKNDYISNLMTTCLSIIPVVNRVVGKENSRVTRGFLSRQYMIDHFEMSGSLQEDLLKFSQGLALEMTFEPYDNDVAITIAHNVGESDRQVKVIIDNKKQKRSFFRNNSFFEIYQKTNEGLRLVFTEPDNL